MLGQHQPAARFKIGLHALDVDHQPFSDIDHRAQRARHHQRQRGEGDPFRLPTADRALVLLELRIENGRREIGRDHRGRQRRGGAHRIALVRQRRGAAATRRRRLERFGDLALHQQRHVAGDLAAGAGQDRQRSGDFGETVAVRMPGRVGNGEIELGCEPLGDVEALFLQCRKRAAGAAELQHQGFLAQPPQPLARARQRRGVARQLEAERHRQRLPQQRARHRHVAAVLASQRGERLGGAIEVLEQRVDRRAQLKHHRGVDDVLAGGAPMDVAGGLLAALADFGGQGVDQRDGEIAGDDGRLAQRGEIVVPDLAGFGDGPGVACRHDADCGRGASERGLEIEHALDASAVVEHGAHLVGRVERRQKRRREQGVRHSRANIYPARGHAPTPIWGTHWQAVWTPFANEAKAPSLPLTTFRAGRIEAAPGRSKQGICDDGNGDDGRAAACSAATEGMGHAQ